MINGVAPITKTYTSAQLADADGIKTSIATVASPVTYVPADFNGALVSGSGRVAIPLPRTVTISRSSSANSYSVSPIVITGTFDGQTVTESLTPANDDGNDTLYGNQPFHYVTSIAIPAQANTSGAFTIGVGDICAPARDDIFIGVKVSADAVVHFAFDKLATATDSHTIVAGQAEVIGFRRILTGSGETSGVSVTVYYGKA
jgi:hypothetical protein